MKNKKKISTIVNLIMGMLILGTFLFPWLQIGEKEFTVFSLLHNASVSGGLENYIRINHIIPPTELTAEISTYIFLLENITKASLIIVFLELVDLVLLILKKKNSFIKMIKLPVCFVIFFIFAVAVEVFSITLAPIILITLVLIDLFINKYFEWIIYEEENNINGKHGKNKVKEKPKFKNHFQEELFEFRKEKRVYLTKELNRIYKKGVMKNIRNFIVFILSGILTVAAIFQVQSINTIFKGLEKYEFIDTSIENIVSSSAKLIMIFVILFLVLSMMNYFRSRYKDYGLLTMLGIEEYSLLFLQLKEYVLSWILSLVLGSALGKFILILITKVLKYYIPEITLSSNLNWSVYLNVFGYSLLIWIIVYVIFNEVVFCMGADKILMKEVQKTRWPQNQNIFLLIGLIIFIFVLWVMGNFIGQKSIYPLLVVVSIGLYLIYFSLNVINLNRIKKDKNNYYEKVININKYFHRFFHHINTQFCTVILVIILFFAFGIKLIDQVPTNTVDEKYPYDLVWMANEEDKDFIEKMKKSYHIEYEALPFSRITTAEFGENIGISEEIYNEWRNEKMDVKDKHMNIIYQSEDKEGNMLGLSWDSQPPYIHIGKGEKRFWLLYGSETCSLNLADFTNEYRVDKKYTKNIIGSFRNHYNENIIVFSDNDYKKIEDNADGANYLVMMNIPKEFSKNAKKEISEYANKHSERYFVDETVGLYDKEESILKDKIERALNTIVYTFISIITLISIIFMLVLKNISELPEMKMKYSFLEQMGMDPKEIKKNIEKEYLREIWYPCLTGTIASTILVIREFYLRNMSAIILQKYLLNYAILLGIFFIVLLIVSFIFTRSFYRYIKNND